jgi:RimJ/RimL family protein N-acetyltransferase
MTIAPVVLEGRHVRLEPLTQEHFSELAAVAFDPELWRLSTVVVANEADLHAYIDAALALQKAGAAMPWVTREKSSGKVVGSTRFLDIQPAHKNLEIGSTWLAQPWQGTGLNTEAKYLQLRHAFEEWGAMRVALKTHHENLRSQAAMRAIGARQEGLFRNHMRMPDGGIRHSVWFGITCEEWPEVKAHLHQRMQRIFGEESGSF